MATRVWLLYRMYLNKADKVLGLVGGFKLYPGLLCVTSSPRYKPMKCPAPGGFATNHAPFSMHEFRTALHGIALRGRSGCNKLHYLFCRLKLVSWACALTCLLSVPAWPHQNTWTILFLCGGLGSMVSSFARLNHPPPPFFFSSVHMPDVSPTRLR